MYVLQYTISHSWPSNARAIMIIISYNTQHNLATDHEDSTDMDMVYSTTDNENYRMADESRNDTHIQMNQTTMYSC